jgi:hypothetical protein
MFSTRIPPVSVQPATILAEYGPIFQQVQSLQL